MPKPTTAAKAVYFFYFAAGAACLPQLTYYYRAAGLSGRMVGILASIAPIASLFGAWIWGGIADATGRQRLVLWLAMLIAIGSCQLFLFGNSFSYLFIVALIFALTAAPIMPLIDNSVLDILVKTKGHYGKIRIWGALGWGIAAPIAGVVIGKLDMWVIFPAYGILLMMCAFAVKDLPIATTARSPGFWRRISIMTKDPRWIFFILAVFARGVGGAFIHHYLMIYMGELGASPALRGAALSFATVSELIAFFYADRLVKRFGPEKVILISIAATSVRLLLHFLVRSAELILIVQLLHGLTFSIFLVAGVTLARNLAPKGLEVTAQGIFTGVHFGAAGMVGAYLGGELLDSVGVHVMYLIAAIASTVGLCAFFAYGWIKRRSVSHQSQ